jgi:hypothetical protein
MRLRSGGALLHSLAMAMSSDGFVDASLGLTNE